MNKKLDDIIATIPWRCGDPDCPADWHQADYWFQADGSYLEDPYACGNHESCDLSDIPSFEEIESAWHEYSQYVQTTGKDPLEEYHVKHTFKRSARYTVQIRNSVGGAMVCRWKRGRGQWQLTPMPSNLANYLLCTNISNNPHTDHKRPVKDETRQDDGTWKPTYYPLSEFLEVARADDQVHKITRTGPFYNIHLTIDEIVERKPSAIARDLKILAGLSARQNQPKRGSNHE